MNMIAASNDSFLLIVCFSQRVDWLNVLHVELLLKSVD